VELGDIRIESSLGQPFRGSIAYALNPNEQLFDYCIFLRPGSLSADVPSITRPKVAVDNGRIVLTGTTPIMEPVLAMQVVVNCPYTARLTREYTLMMSPATAFKRNVSETSEATAAMREPIAQAAATTAAVPVAATTRSAPVAPRAQVAAVTAASKPTPVLPPATAAAEPLDGSSVGIVEATTPISANSRYFVQTGDSLSAIARRIENRGVGMWPAVQGIFAANPHAFVDGDPNQLIAAVWLDIPEFALSSSASDNSLPVIAAASAGSELAEDDASVTDVYRADMESGEPAVAETVPEATPAEPLAADNAPEPPAPIETAAPVVAATPRDADDVALTAGDDETSVESGITADVATPAEPAFVEDAIAEEVAVAAAAAEQPRDIIDDTANLRPGDIVATGESAASDNVRNVPVVSRTVTRTDRSAGIPTWIWLAAGAAIAFVATFVAFGRTILARFTTGPELAAEFSDDIFDDEPTRESRIVDDVDFQFEDNGLGSQSISLDADLGEGTGLRDGADLDVAQDFGFSATRADDFTAAVDLELPAEAAVEPEPHPTDIIEPTHRIEETLYAEETPAAGDTQSSTTIDATDYDLSMIVDATKQSLDEEELTAKDLQAVLVEQETAGQTLASEVDIAILAQDYEDEFTQTQALNDEIARAAEELAMRMDEDDSAEVTSQLEGIDDPAMTAFVDAAADAGNDDLTDISDLTDTGINPQLTANLQNPGNERTVEMPHRGSDKTVEMPYPGSEPTVEMANPGNDPTIELEIESGTVNTRKPQVS
jgi:nucleoid-associated protein YgaU